MRKSNLYNIYVKDSSQSVLANERVQYEGTIFGTAMAFVSSLFIFPLVLPAYLGYKVLSYIGKRVNEEIKINKTRSSALDQQFIEMALKTPSGDLQREINSTSLISFSENITTVSGILNYYRGVDLENGARWLEESYKTYMDGNLSINPSSDFAKITLENFMTAVCPGNLPLLAVDTTKLKCIKTKEKGMFLPPIFGLGNKCMILDINGKKISYKETTFTVNNGNINSTIDEYVSEGGDLNTELATILIDINKSIVVLKNLNSRLEKNETPRKGIIFKEKTEAYSDEVKQYYVDTFRLIIAYYKMLLEESMVNVNRLYNELINMNNRLMGK